MPHFRFVVIGAGPAGGAAALELASDAAAPSVALVGNEPHPPYERPPLSKRTLDPAHAAGPALLFGGAPGLSARGVSLFAPDGAVELDRARRTVRLASGAALSYDRLLISTGASARTLRVTGAGLPGVHTLRTHENAAALASALSPGTRLVVVGGGFIGLEVAATARRRGCHVCLVETGARLMERAAPQAIADKVREKFEAEGVDIRLAAQVVEIVGTDVVHGVVLSTGERLDAQAVVVGIGALPNDALARGAGLDVDNGIVTDLDGLTSDPLIHAAGDVACRLHEVAGHPAWRKRLEAWEPAIEQGVAAARAMLGRVAAPPPPPWVWSDQFDWNLQFAGHGELADEIVARPGAVTEALTVLQLSRGRLVGAVSLNDPRAMALCRRALFQDVELDVRRLADPREPLRDLLRPPARASTPVPERTRS